MKTLKVFLLGSILFLCLLSCEKDTIPTPLDEFTNAEIELRSQDLLDDPELGENDLIIPQTDFLFDANKDSILLDGQATIGLVDEMWIDPIYDLSNLRQSIDFYERTQPIKKVASAMIRIYEIQDVMSGGPIALAAIKFDFGHGSLHGEATLELLTKHSDAFEFKLKSFRGVKGTRYLAGVHDAIIVNDLQVKIESMDDHHLGMACMVNLGFK